MNGQGKIAMEVMEEVAKARAEKRAKQDSISVSIQSLYDLIVLNNFKIDDEQDLKAFAYMVARINYKLIEQKLESEDK